MAAVAEAQDDALGECLGALGRGVEMEVGRERRLVGRVDAGEILDLAGARLGVEALRIALLDDR
jgi:hypothetical protein